MSTAPRNHAPATVGSCHCARSVSRLTATRLAADLLKARRRNSLLFVRPRRRADCITCSLLRLITVPQTTGQSIELLCRKLSNVRVHHTVLPCDSISTLKPLVPLARRAPSPRSGARMWNASAAATHGMPVAPHRATEGFTGRQPIAINHEYRIICVQRNRASVRPLCSFVTVASQTCVVRPRWGRSA